MQRCLSQKGDESFALHHVTELRKIQFLSLKTEIWHANYDAKSQGVICVADKSFVGREERPKTDFYIGILFGLDQVCELDQHCVSAEMLNLWYSDFYVVSSHFVGYCSWWMLKVSVRVVGLRIVPKKSIFHHSFSVNVVLLSATIILSCLISTTIWLKQIMSLPILALIWV